MRGWGNVLSHAVRLHLAFPVLPGLLSRRFLLPPFWQRLNGLFHVKHSGRRRGDVRDNDAPHGCLVERGATPVPGYGRRTTDLPDAVALGLAELPLRLARNSALCDDPASKLSDYLRRAGLHGFVVVHHA